MSGVLRKAGLLKTRASVDRIAVDEWGYPSGMVWCPMKMSGMALMAHDQNAAIFFGHPTKPEFKAMAEFSHKIGFKRGVVDHPFSPFVNLTIEEMKDAAAADLWLNFTFDELSPLLGIDPANMYKAIRTVGPTHCTLSSDAGEPLFPNSVESLRLLRGYMFRPADHSLDQSYRYAGHKRADGTAARHCIVDIAGH